MDRYFFLERFLAICRYQKAVKHIPKNSVVCDIGCGTDFLFLKYLDNKIKYGIGFDKKVDDFKIKRLEIKKLEIKDKIPLEAKSLDAVTILAVLEHLQNPQAILNECFRILKKGGKLILTTPMPAAKPVLEFLAFKLNLIDQNQIKEHQNYFSPKIVKKMLAYAGFEKANIKTKYFGLGFNCLAVAKK